MGKTADEFNARQREREAASCVHFNGIQRQCGAGLEPQKFAVGPVGGGRVRLPCVPSDHTPERSPTCASFDAMGMERVMAREKRTFGRFELIKQGKSPCCEAPLDESRMTERRGAKWGPCFCSKCNKLVFMA